jgi:hypothetical protein
VQRAGSKPQTYFAPYGRAKIGLGFNETKKSVCKRFMVRFERGFTRKRQPTDNQSREINPQEIGAQRIDLRAGSGLLC